ncbi:MAG: hypothetical protein LAO07_12090, partial [Acidobacteriia bacterium]|nr:hypothetical protein [Terriglobia bacterium]
MLISMAVLGWISLGSQPSAAAASGTTPTPNVSISSPRLAGLYVRLPISFEVNRGQTDRGVKFLARGPGYTLFLTPHETVLALHGPAP